MACLNMSSRVSFSHNFAVDTPPAQINRAMTLHCQDDLQDDGDFEFSVGSRPMMAADQLFSKGRILPLKTTLRDELREVRDNGEEKALPPKGPTQWKEMLGLRKPHGTAKKSEDGGAAEVGMLTGRM